jgi:nitrogen regulatory protein PII
LTMKAIMIIYNQAHTEKVEFLLDKLGINGYSLWENVQGRGTSTGVPHLGTHAWPEINKSVLAIVDDGIVDIVLENVKRIDSVNSEVGIRAFVWDVLKMV